MLLRFQPIYQTRVWGGRELERQFGRVLPDAQPYGESWELVDRPEAESWVAADSPHFPGVGLGELWREHREAVFGPGAPETERFPLLLKILDAREALSLQTHPPAQVAAALGGEPKTEMWVIALADPGAKIYAGVQPGVTRESFARAIEENTVEACVPAFPCAQGDFIFIPSGRLHAIGAGLVIFEIQQNSDTTYRVYDWGRVGLDGRPRALHVEESLASIDFADTSPALGAPQPDGLLVSCPHFTVRQIRLAAGESAAWPCDGCASVAIVIAGRGSLAGEPLAPGDHVLVTAQQDQASLVAHEGLWALEVRLGAGQSG